MFMFRIYTTTIGTHTHTHTHQWKRFWNNWFNESTIRNLFQSWTLYRKSPFILSLKRRRKRKMYPLEHKIIINLLIEWFKSYTVNESLFYENYKIFWTPAKKERRRRTSSRNQFQWNNVKMIHCKVFGLIREYDSYIIEIEWYSFNMDYFDDCCAPHDLSSTLNLQQIASNIIIYLLIYLAFNLNGNVVVGRKAMKNISKKNRRYNVELC